jgi:hypothetical protein
MAQPWFIATETFTPQKDERWRSYIAWSGLKQLDEVVSLDSMLCPTLLPEVKDDYWPHIINENFLLNYFVDLNFLLAQVEGVPERNLLGVVRGPKTAERSISDQRFEFMGYDLLEVAGGVSALTNCGGFSRAFNNSELSPKGLITSHGRAVEVQAALRKEYPEEHHADCDVWEIYRAVAL